MKDFSLIKIKQHFPDNSINDIKSEVCKELFKLKPLINPGSRIALAVGSRGIRNLLLVIKEVAEFVKENNAFPFIVPAMGSHGDAKASGQSALLAGYGISEETLGIPVISSMEVVEITGGDSPVPVYMDKNAYESDGIILINRVKPHTDFHAKYESGLVKMAVIGLGKEKQASIVHRYGVYGLSVLLPIIAEQIISAGKIIGGIALVENAFDETMLVKAIIANEFLETEPVLLEIARQNMPSLPIDDIDLLLIDQMGKDISGVGIDPNIIGRIKIKGQKEPEKPDIKAIVVLDLTEASHGNAIGIGLSDVITKKLFNKINFSSTYINTVTSSFLERAKIPIVADNDVEAFNIAFRSCGFLEAGEEKIIRIKDTLHLEEIYVSEPILDIIKDKGGIEVIKEQNNLFLTGSDVSAF